MKPEQARALREPFPPETIGKLPKGGVMLDYVGHAAVCDRLLQVDPTWSWEPMSFSPEGLPAVDPGGNLWIRLTVCGVTRIGVGDGKNPKELISDAIRNAAMRFGVALDLWAKEPLGSGPEAQGAGKPLASREAPKAGDATTPEEPTSLRADTTSLAVRFLEVCAAAGHDQEAMQALAKKHDGDKAWFEESIRKGEAALSKVQPEQQTAFVAPKPKAA